MGSLSELFDLFRISSSSHCCSCDVFTLAMEIEEQMLTLIITGPVAGSVKRRRGVLDGIAYR